MKALHPLDPSIELPLYIANFVLMEYGTGAVFGVPAHMTSAIWISRASTICRCAASSPMARRARPLFHGDEAYTGPGTIVNSHFLDGMDIDDAKRAVIRRAEEDGWGKGSTVFRLRDWGVSRQRYWGTPIPIIHCDAVRCGAGAQATSCRWCCPRTSASTCRAIRSTGILTWKHVDCPSCGGAARARDRHAGYVRRFVVVFHPLRQPAR